MLRSLVGSEMCIRDRSYDDDDIGRVEASSWEPAARGGPRIARGGEILSAALIFKVFGPACSPGDWANPCVSACPDQGKTGRRFIRWCRSIYRSQNSNLETRSNIPSPFPPAYAPVRCIVLFIPSKTACRARPCARDGCLTMMITWECESALCLSFW